MNATGVILCQHQFWVLMLFPPMLLCISSPRDAPDAESTFLTHLHQWHRVIIRCHKKAILWRLKKPVGKYCKSCILLGFLKLSVWISSLMQTCRQRMYSAGMITLTCLLITQVQTPTLWTDQSDRCRVLSPRQTCRQVSAYHKHLNWTFLLLVEACRGHSIMQITSKPSMEYFSQSSDIIIFKL